MKKIKDWTILIYANGNNDLEPEMYNTKLNLEKIGSSEEINILIEMGREAQEVIHLVRSKDTFLYKDKWIGVRRYYIKKGESELLEDIGETNMSNPVNLYHFIKWGMENYPAKQYILVLGGHGYEFVGTMTDYTKEGPCIMGIPEMIKAINQIYKYTNRKIDLLILDTCFANAIEVIYELGKEKNHVVQNMLTYIQEGPIKGLDYSKIINLAKKNTGNINALVKEIIDHEELDLIGFKIAHRELKKIKKSISELAYSYLNEAQKPPLLPWQIMNDFDKNKPWSQYLKKYYTHVASIVIYYRRCTQEKYPLINIATICLDSIDKLTMYYKLGFSKNNYWTYVLSNKTLQDTMNLYPEEKLKPLKLNFREVYLYTNIMNNHLEKEEVFPIVKSLYEYKEWKMI